MDAGNETTLELAPLTAAVNADPRADKFLRPTKDGTYSLLFKSSKGIEGRLARKLTEDILPLLDLPRKRRVSFSVELILYNCLLVLLYEQVYSPYRIVVKYTRRRGHYGTVTKYGLKDLSYRTHIAVLEAMKKAEYLELNTEKPQPFRGEKKSTTKKRLRKDEPPSSKWRSRSSFWPTPKLVELLERHRSEIAFREHKQPAEDIVVKDSEKNPIVIEETREVKALRKAVEEINENQEHHSYTLFVPDGDLVQFYIPPEERGAAIVPVGALRAGTVALVFENWHQSILCLTSKDAVEGSGRHRPRTYSTLLCSIPGFQKTWEHDVESRYQVSVSNPYNLYLESKSKANTGRDDHRSKSNPVFSITGNNGDISHIEKCRIVSDVTATYSTARSGVEVGLDRTTRYHRVFNESSLDKGGRFYAGIQVLPSEMRPYLQIDDRPTLEADFNALHLRLLYAMVLGRELSPFKDAYAIPFPGWNDQKAVRKALKYALFILLNAKSRQKGLKSVQQELNFRRIVAPQGVKATDLESVLLEAYPEARASLYTGLGLGLDLQYLDSKIAEKVMLAFSRLGKGIVGIHDGFRVKEEDFDELILVMEDAYKSKTGFRARVCLKG